MEFKNNKLSNIWKLLFNEEQVVEEKEQVVEDSEEKAKFLDATLEDGTLVQIEPALEVGAAVIVIDSEGNPLPAPDATHILADGTQITTVEGLITEIMPVEEEVLEEEVEEEMSNEPSVSQEQVAKKVVESIIKESHFASEESLNELKNSIEAKFAEEIKAMKESMFKAFEEFGKTEEKEPTKKPAKFKREKKASWLDKKINK